MAPRGDFLARLFLGNDIVDEVDYRNKAANKAWRQAGREYHAQRGQGPQVLEDVPPPIPQYAPQAAGGSRSRRTTQQPREKSARDEIFIERGKKVSRRQTVKEPRPPIQGNPPPMRRETASHRSGRDKGHLEAPRRPEDRMDIYAIGKYGGVSPRVTRNDHPDPQPAQQLFPPQRELRSSSKTTRQSSHRGAPVGFPEQLHHPALPEARGRSKRSTRLSHDMSTRGHQYEDYHGIPVVEVQPRGSR